MRHRLPGSFIQAVGATVMVVSLLQIGSAQVMQSTNYKMQSDSVNTGGSLSNSTNYQLEDTAGEIATGNGSSTNYLLKAGYQQMQEVYLSLSAIPDVTLAPSLGGLTGGTATGSTAFVVTTDSAAGYTVTIQASTSPAMVSGVHTITDYVPVAGGVPDFVFTTGASDAHFAYSPEGADVALRFQDAGSVCSVAGSDTANRCWDGLTTTPVEIVRGSSNHPTGATTTIVFNVGIGSTATVPVGEYVATTTITALAL